MSTDPILAFDIGGHKYGAAICTADGQVLAGLLHRTELRADAAEIAGGLFAQVEQLRRRHPEVFDRIRLCGIGFGGPVKDNRPWRSLHVGGWEAIDLCALVRERLGLTAVMGNDGDVSALGEHRFGAGRGTSAMVFLTVSTGIGGGIVLGGKLWRGAHGFAGELGHLKIAPDGPRCPCGSVGCLESLCSGTALGAQARRAAAADPEEFADLVEFVGGRVELIDARAVFGFAGREGVDSGVLLDSYLENLARGVGSIINAFDPDMIVIGGGVSKAGETLFGPLRRLVPKYVMPNMQGTIRIEPAALGDHTVFLGAAAFAYELAPAQ